VAIEKSVGSQLAVPMSLDITRQLFQEIYYFKILLAYIRNVKLMFITLIQGGL